MRRLTPTLLLAALALGGCASAPATTTEAEARQAVSETERSVRRAESDSAMAPYLTDALRDMAEADAALASGDTDEAAHLAYLARQRVRIAELQAEIDAAAGEVGAAGEEGGNRVLILDAFRSARVDLQPKPEAAVERVAEYLLAHPGRVVLVESFTDSTGDEDRNLDLSVRRADAVKERLVEAGVEPERILTAGYGQEYPVATNETSEGQRQNRRIEIVFATGLDALPTR